MFKVRIFVLELQDGHGDGEEGDDEVEGDHRQGGHGVVTVSPVGAHDDSDPLGGTGVVAVVALVGATHVVSGAGHQDDDEPVGPVVRVQDDGALVQHGAPHSEPHG